MLTLLLIGVMTFADSVEVYYSQQDTTALHSMLERAEEREHVLLCRYRLYPLTKDESYLSPLPGAPSKDATARALALLSGLWGYHAAEASFIEAITYGRRAMRFLEAARKHDSAAPFVLLIAGQSLVARPPMFGGDDRKALEHFERLRRLLPGHPHSSISMMEVDSWIWYALAEVDPPRARALKERLLGQDPPPLHRDFLLTAH